MFGPLAAIIATTLITISPIMPKTIATTISHKIEILTVCHNSIVVYYVTRKKERHRFDFVKKRHLYVHLLYLACFYIAHEIVDFAFVTCFIVTILPWFNAIMIKEDYFISTLHIRILNIV
jgi:uncharacterized membrane protein